MLLIKTKIKESPIHGIGLFADQYIPRGTEIWRFTDGFDTKFTREEITAFPELLQVYIAKYAWKSVKSDLYCFSADNGKYFNHSENPNVLSEYRDNEQEVITVAVRDIEVGEELLDNYSSFENDPTKEDSVIEEIIERYYLDDEVDPRKKIA